jgi:hypothetical protein
VYVSFELSIPLSVDMLIDPAVDLHCFEVEGNIHLHITVRTARPRPRPAGRGLETVVRTALTACAVAAD